MPHRVRSTHARRTAARVAAVLLILGVSACGGSDEPGADAGASSAATTAPDEPQTPATQPGSTVATPPGEQESEAVTVTATDFELQVGEDGLSAGEVEFTLVNDGGATHDLVVERDGEEIAAVGAADPGETSTVTVTLEPGTYVLSCSIADHRAMGMETTVEVT